MTTTAYPVRGSFQRSRARSKRFDVGFAMQPKVSILIPVYNRPEQILRAVHGALAQTHRNLEVIISDNASTDGTWAAVQRLAAEDARVLAYRNPTNLGPIRNWIGAMSQLS